MRVLVTGSNGNIGTVQTEALLQAGYTIRTLDRSARYKDCDWEHIPGDVCDLYTVRRAMQNVDAVIHLAAIPNDRHGAGPDVLHVNVTGTTNVLFAAHEAGVERVIAYSSVNSMGFVGGRRYAHYLPVDDAHPKHPNSPYQLSKHLAEEACRSFSETHGLKTFCLRPVYVVTPQRMHWLQERSTRDLQWGRSEYFAYVDVRDVCDAAMKCLTVQNLLHDSFLLTAEDTTLALPTLETARQTYPHALWKQNPEEYTAQNPYRSFIDCSHAQQALNWRAVHSWRSS